MKRIEAVTGLGDTRLEHTKETEEGNNIEEGGLDARKTSQRRRRMVMMNKRQTQRKTEVGRGERERG